jgi:hypothetical protein
MSHTFYALYNLETLDIMSISGSPFGEIPDGVKTCKVYEKDGEDFHNSRKHMHEYIINVDADGYAKFKYKYLHIVTTRNIINSNQVQDLNYKIIFFDFLDIRYQYSDTKLTLTFDIDSLETKYQDNFKNSVVQDSKAMIYVTRYQDPTVLITKFEIDLYKFMENKIISLPLNVDIRISVWAIQI